MILEISEKRKEEKKTNYLFIYIQKKFFISLISEIGLI